MNGMGFAGNGRHTSVPVARKKEPNTAARMCMQFPLQLTPQRVVGGKEEAHARHALRAAPLQRQPARQAVVLQVAAAEREKGQLGSVLE